MNLYSRHTFCPQKAYDQTLFLFGAIYKFRSHLHHSVTTLILNCKVSRLARLTGHMTLSDTTNCYSYRPHRFPRKYKNAETFWRSLVLSTNICSHAEFPLFIFDSVLVITFLVKSFLFIRHGWRKWTESCHKILFQSRSICDRNN